MDLSFGLGIIIGFVTGGIISVVFFHNFLNYMRKERDKLHKGGKQNVSVYTRYYPWPTYNASFNTSNYYRILWGKEKVIEEAL